MSEKLSEPKASSNGGGFSNYGLLVALLAVLVAASAFNQFQLGAVSAAAAKLSAAPSAYPAASAAPASPAALTTSPASAAPSSPPPAALAAADVRPTGVPSVYGSELGIKYDDVSGSNPQLADQTIRKLSQYDEGITLQGGQLARYVKLGSMIACEYCCGAKTLVFPNGQPACGCAHSYAMRGLAKYLISKHGAEFSDDQILEEMGKWKVLFFPGVHAQKAAVLKGKGIELNFINLASNKYRGIEAGAPAGGSGGSMVGGC